jgi:sporulation integral membrane protein YlbJ
MTLSRTREHTEAEPTFFQYTLGLMTVFCLMLLLRNSEIAIKSVGDGLLLCAKTVIPSLFPFMVLSEVLVLGGFGEMILGRLTKPLQRLLRLPSAGGSAILMGMLCGFPTGAKYAVSALSRGELTRPECERVLSCCNLPSTAFLINAVGVSLCKSRGFGIMLYLVAALSALICGLLLRPHRMTKQNITQTAISSPVPAVKGAKLLTASIRSATAATLTICAYVVFFSAITGTVEQMLERLSLPELWHVLLTGSLELSGGVSTAAAISSPFLKPLLIAATVGWSGLSVHCQLIALCEGHGLSFRTYFFSKLLQSLLCTLLCAVALFLFPSLWIG